MGLVKKAGIAFLSFLLFCSLSVFGMTYVMNRTLLSPDFAIAQVDRLDVPELVGEMVREQISLEELPPEMGSISDVVEDTIADLEPWIRQQTDTAIYAGYDYLLGKSESLSITLDLAPVRERLRESVGELAEEIPTTYTIDESTIAMMSPDIMNMLEQARIYVGYLLMAYRISIGVMIATILGLIFLHRRVRGATRSIGIPFLISGIMALVGSIVGKGIMLSFIPSGTIPAQLQTWLIQLVNDLFAPMKMLGIGFMVTGIALLIVSVAYKRGRPSGEQV